MTYIAVVQCDVVLCCIIVLLEIVVILVLVQPYVIVRYRYVAVYAEVPHLLTNILYNFSQLVCSLTRIYHHNIF